MPKRYREALEYHSMGRKGKLEVIPTKPTTTQQDLSMAYTPGVAEPCRAIYKNPDDVFLYTAKGNLVAVVTNGTAVLGLGDIGPMAGKPVMEGKAVLFKRFADIDVFDIELDAPDEDTIVAVVTAMAPTFGGINLEDIAAPVCFEVERRLSETLDIPVFHDDQHGTAIISGAALLNALELQDKKIEDVKMVFSGAGAAAIATARLYVSLGATRENILLVDSKGVCYAGRRGLNKYKEEFAHETDRRTLADAMEGADVFVGCSVAGLVTQDMVRSMAPKPIVFAMANPDPEISYEDATAVRGDLIMATGRSDYPNQVNNVLGFPFIFRGALDVRARKINLEMKIAAVRALAALAREDVPDVVLRAYDLKRLQFGPDYIIPKPFDPRVLLYVAPAVARAAVETGVARQEIDDFDAYKERLERLLGRPHEIMRPLINRARKDPKRIVFPEGNEPRILRACQGILDEGIARPILIGNDGEIRARAKELGLQLDGATVVDPEQSPRSEAYAKALYALRQRRGVTWAQARRLCFSRTYFACMMVHEGDADGMVGGLHKHYQDTIRPVLQTLVAGGERQALVSSVYLMILKERLLFFADCTVNIEPSAEELAEIAINTAEVARTFEMEPRIAMLSFSNYGSAPEAYARKMRTATDLVRRHRPDLEIDGEMQADTAVSEEVRADNFPFSLLTGDANVLIFPDLQSGNIAYKLLQRLAGATAIGPLLVGMDKPVNVLQTESDVTEIVNIAAITSLEAQDTNFLKGWAGSGLSKRGR